MCIEEIKLMVKVRPIATVRRAVTSLHRYCYHHHHHHHLFALIKEYSKITTQGYGEETSRNHQAYERGHLGCH